MLKLLEKNKSHKYKSAVFRLGGKTDCFSKLVALDAIAAYGRAGGIGVTAGLAGFDSAFFAKVAAADGENSGVLFGVSEFLHGFPKELAAALVSDLSVHIFAHIRAGIFMEQNHNVFAVMYFCDKGFGSAFGRRAHITAVIHTAKVLFAEATQSFVAGNKPSGKFAAFIETESFSKFFDLFVHYKFPHFYYSLFSI